MFIHTATRCCRGTQCPRPSSRRCFAARVADHSLVKSDLQNGPGHLTRFQQVRYTPQAGRALLAFVACATPLVSWPCLCENEGDGSEEDEEFDFNFAKPPVVPAPLQLRFAAHVKPGADGRRPTSDIEALSVFSLPVERGWPRDKLSAQDVAESMADVLADRLPRFAADYSELQLTGAPLQLRGGVAHWPAASMNQEPAELRSTYLPKPFPPLLSFYRLEGPETGFLLDHDAKLIVSCRSLGVHRVQSDVGDECVERLDIELTTSVKDFPVAGWAWGFVGCGGRWWFEKYRLPFVRRVLEAYHQMAHEQMMLYYVAALAD